MLKQLAYEVNGLIRQSDLFYRLGGDEFAIIFIEMDLLQATLVSEKIRHIHSQLAMTIDDQKMTLSIGIATLQKNDDPGSLYKRADDALYYAKQHGRNKVSGGLTN
jgi:diguanylate cyclase (GGDEF)-like protein